MFEVIAQLTVVYIPKQTMQRSSDLHHRSSLTPSEVACCCCPWGTSDQKKPRHSGSSKMYGSRRVRRRTQLIARRKKRQLCRLSDACEPAVWSRCVWQECSAADCRRSTSLLHKVAIFDGNSSRKDRISTAGISEKISCTVEIFSDQNCSQNESSFDSIC